MSVSDVAPIPELVYRVTIPRWIQWRRTAHEGKDHMDKKIIELAGGFDPATEDLAITSLADEEEHRRDFVGFLKELEAGRVAA